MKMGRETPSEELSRRIDFVEAAVCAAVRPRAHQRLEKIEWRSEDDFSVGPLPIRSAQLGKVLAGCREAAVLCATLGSEVDALQRKYALLSGVDALIVQAVGATLIESYIDELEKRLVESVPRVKSLRMRFSPGYGDLPLSLQPQILALLDAQRTCGIVLTSELLMIPSKSVTAIIGIDSAPVSALGAYPPPKAPEGSATRRVGSG